MSVMKRLSGIVQAKANKALDKAENPADMLDLTYSKQLENLQKVRRALADVATAKKRLELQANQLKTQADKLQSQAKQALSQGNEDLAREALSRRAAIGEQLEGLGTQHEQVEAQQAQLTQTSQRLSAQIEAFRTKKETMKATYQASKAEAGVGEAVSGISESMTDAGMTMQRAQDKIAQMQAHAGAIDDLLTSGALPDMTGTQQDDIQQQLNAASASSEVDAQLAAMKAEIATSRAAGCAACICCSGERRYARSSCRSRRRRRGLGRGELRRPAMIVRILGDRLYEVAPSDLGGIEALDSALDAALKAGDEESFSTVLSELIDKVRSEF